MLVQICVVVCLWYRRIWEYIQLKTPIIQGSATRNITVYFVVRKLNSYHVIYTVFTLTSTTWFKYWHQQTVLSEVDCSQNSEAWATTSLYFLKQLKWAGAVLNDLLNFYCSVIRPVLEYASPVSHSSLTVALEYLQKRAMNSVFSGGIDYTTCLIIAGVDTLATWREYLTKRFLSSKGSVWDFMSPSSVTWKNDPAVANKLHYLNTFQSLTIKTERFRKTFIPYCLRRYQ